MREHLIQVAQSPKPCLDWTTRFPANKGQPTLDLLDRMLKFNVSERISVDDALAHPFFAPIRNLAAETVFEGAAGLDYSFEEVPVQPMAVKQRIYEEVQRYH